jgi:hypothetical protein
MRQLVILAVFCSILFGATNNITFQGTLANQDGSAYNGPIWTAVRFFTTVNAVSHFHQELSSFNVINGTYTIVFPLADTKIDEMVTINDQGIFMEIYIVTGNSGTNLFASSNKLLEIDPNNSLPAQRIQIVAVPMTFTSRGVYFNSEKNTLRIGEDYKSINDDSLPAQGMVVKGQTSIGTYLSNGAKLNVEAVKNGSTYGEAIQVRDNIVVGGVVTASRVYNARWQ